mgnify:CR=1 FL=1
MSFFSRRKNSSNQNEHNVEKSWVPTNPRLSSNLPLSSLIRIFIFTNGDGKTVLSCPVANGTLADTAGAPLNEFLGKVPFDVIAESDIEAQIRQTGQFPDSAWMAMNNIIAHTTQDAQTGNYKTVVRTFSNPNTKESGACVLLYKPFLAHLTVIRDSSFAHALIPTILFLNEMQVASLKSNESVTLPITQLHNILRTNSVGSNNCRYEFDAQDGSRGTIHVSAGAFKVKEAKWV